MRKRSIVFITLGAGMAILSASTTLPQNISGPLASGFEVGSTKVQAPSVDAKVPKGKTF